MKDVGGLWKNTGELEIHFCTLLLSQVLIYIYISILFLVLQITKGLLFNTESEKLSQNNRPFPICDCTSQNNRPFPIRNSGLENSVYFGREKSEFLDLLTSKQ